MQPGDSYERVITDPTLIDGLLAHLMDNEGFTYGEALAILLLTRGEVPWNNYPGVFGGMIPLEETW